MEKDDKDIGAETVGSDRSVRRTFAIWETDRAIRAIFQVCVGLVLVVAVTLVLTLVVTAGRFGIAPESMQFPSGSGLSSGPEWAPSLPRPSYGVLPVIWGTLWVTILAGAIAMPIGLAAAVYQSEYATPAERAWGETWIAVSHAIPSVVLGYFALAFLPRSLVMIPSPDRGGILTCGLVLAVMILPTVVRLCAGVLTKVPSELREAAIALGASQDAVIRTVVLPSALLGIAGSFLLALSRVVGEVVITSMILGHSPRITWNLWHPATTLGSEVVACFTRQSAGVTIDPYLPFVIGLFIFAATFAMQFLATRLLHGFQIRLGSR
ncbi:MAG TPA: ABC transporter permease subunit [Pirellulaceae bacterium]